MKLKQVILDFNLCICALWLDNGGSLINGQCCVAQHLQRHQAHVCSCNPSGKSTYSQL